MEYKWKIRILLNNGITEHVIHTGQEYNSLDVAKQYIERDSNNFIGFTGSKGQLFVRVNEISAFEVYQ